MAGKTTQAARQRFVTGSRARAARRLRRAKLVAAALLASALTSCVSMRVSQVGEAPVATPGTAATPAAIAPSFADVPIVAVGTMPEATGPSFLAAVDQRDRMRATLCLASAIYYEAASESEEGQRAVAQVVLNRVRHREWPQTICGVVFQGSDRPGCQFSFACDGAMARGPSLIAWTRARRIAEEALNGATYAPVGSSTFYHTLQVAPAWRHRLIPTVVVGAHIFYRMPADAHDAALLPFRYAGGEPTPGPLPRVAPPAQLLTVTMPSVAPVAPLPSATLPSQVIAAAPPAPPPSRDQRYVPGALPDSDIRPEWRDSGSWVAPAR